MLGVSVISAWRRVTQNYAVLQRKFLRLETTVKICVSLISKAARFFVRLSWPANEDFSERCKTPAPCGSQSVPKKWLARSGSRPNLCQGGKIIKRFGLVSSGTLIPLGTLVLLATGFQGCPRSEPRLRKIYTEHLGQLTGTVLNSAQDIGITGTDLGVSLADPSGSNRIIFLFGDTWTIDPQRSDQDSTALAWPIAPSRDNMPKLMWIYGGESSQFTNINIPNVNLGGMNVPVEGVVANGKIHIFASAGWNEDENGVARPDAGRHCCSALAHTDGLAYEPNGLTFDYKVPSERFINISAFTEGETVWIFGTGHYRKSSVFLAKVHTSQIADRDKWEYYQGRSDTNAQWGPGEDSAVPVVISNAIGELSVRKHPDLGYLMVYGAEGNVPRGIHLRRADQPWGPWERPISIFDPGQDSGWGHFLHLKASEVGYDDGLAEPGLHRNLDNDLGVVVPAGKCPGNGWREECGGAEYGPYLVPQWFTKTPDGGYSIVYTLSSWVPYQVHLMRTILADKGGNPAPPSQRGQNLPPAKLTNGDFGGWGDCQLGGWQSLGDTFGVFKGNDGRCRMTTFTATKGDNTMGALFQDFTVDATTKAIRFLVHGGEATVRLHRGTDIVRETRGRSGHEPRNSPDTRVCWQLSEYAGETLRIAIFDGKTGPWGFIGATGFELLNTPECY